MIKILHINQNFFLNFVFFLVFSCFCSRIIPSVSESYRDKVMLGLQGFVQYTELVRRLQSSEPSGKSHATCLMSLVKHGHGVLLADREDDPFVVGGVDNAIILYRAIEKDGIGLREGERAEGYSPVIERPGDDDVFTDRRHKSTCPRVG